MRSTPKHSVLTAAVFYSIFALLPFAHLVVADVLLYAMALFLEFGSLIVLRRREPTLRGSFRIPLNTKGVIALALIPAVVLVVVVVLEMHDGEYGMPALMGSLLFAGLGVPAYWVGRRVGRATG